MKLIIAGSRDLEVEAIMGGIIRHFGLQNASEIVSGGATGVDKAGEQWCETVQRMYGTQSGAPTLKKFPADWHNHGKAAGPIRNQQMAEYADELLLIWDGSSKGSANMKKAMQAQGKKIYEVILKAPT